MKRLIIDLDNTLTLDDPSISYEKKLPNLAVINKVKTYKKKGFTIVISTSRNVNTYKNSIGLINANTLPKIINWLKLHKVPFDEIIVGKPWCGKKGFIVDDKAIRPDEFTEFSYSKILKLTRKKGF
jgi:capsule biosynthesis phosphatase